MRKRKKVEKLESKPATTRRLVAASLATTGEFVSVVQGRCARSLGDARAGAGRELQRRHCATTQWFLGC
jgi:hypothetical protein